MVQGFMSKSHTMGGDLSLTVLFILDIMVNYCGTTWWTSLVVPLSAGRKLFSCRDIRDREMQYINHVSFNTLDDAYSERIAVVLTCMGGTITEVSSYTGGAKYSILCCESTYYQSPPYPCIHIGRGERLALYRWLHNVFQ